jgi:hypothetical protein
MDNQHRKIYGYRELSQAEIDLINEIKTSGRSLEELVKHVDTYLFSLGVDSGVPDGEARRWLSIARTHFQEGLMALTRAVARPTYF